MPTLFRRIAAPAALWAATALVPSAGPAAPEPGPMVHEIIHRVLTANAQAPKVESANVLFKFRLRQPRTEPPNCEFEGTLHLTHTEQVVSIGRRTYGLTCWIVNRFVIGRLFEAREPVESFLSRFDFTIADERLIEGHRFYLLRGRAHDPRTRPRGLTGWVDYDRGLITEGTVDYDWGVLETEQHYAQREGAWVLDYQYLRTPRFDASMEVFYSHFQFTPR